MTPLPPSQKTRHSDSPGSTSAARSCRSSGSSRRTYSRAATKLGPSRCESDQDLPPRKCISFCKNAVKCNFLEILCYLLPNFGGLVLGCFEADFCERMCMLQHFSRSTTVAHVAHFFVGIFWVVFPGFFPVGIPTSAPLQTQHLQLSVLICRK